MLSFKNIINRIKNDYFLKVILSILSVWILGSILISFLEPGAFKNIKNSLWWSIVTMTTVGYGDMAPITVPGRILAILIMLSGIILVAIVTATISSTFVTKKIMEGKGLEKINLTNHILLCGWSSNIDNLVKGLIQSTKKKQIVLVNDQPQNNVDNLISHFPNESIRFVRGNFSEDSILEKANVSNAEYALLLNNMNEHDDERIILSTLTIKKISKKVKVIAQICDQNKIPFLKRANADAILSGNDYNSFMSIANIIEPSAAQAIDTIIDSNSNSSIYSTDIPENFIGKKFSDLHYYFLNEIGDICLGLFYNEENVGISDILSSDSSALDKFIEKKLKEAGHSLNEKNNMNIILNPNKDEIIQKGQGAILLK